MLGVIIIKKNKKNKKNKLEQKKQNGGENQDGCQS
jgi:hypothetical protein